MYMSIEHYFKTRDTDCLQRSKRKEMGGGGGGGGGCLTNLNSV